MLADIHQGYLIKSPPLKTPTHASMKAWRKRYFVVHAPPFPQETVIRYYSDQESHRSAVEPKGEIPLSQISAVKPVPGTARHANMFEITTHTRSFFLSAPTVEEMHRWIYTIRKLLKQSYDPSVLDNGSGRPFVPPMLGNPGGASSSDLASIPRARKDVYHRTDFSHVPSNVRQAVSSAFDSQPSVRGGIPLSASGASSIHRTPSKDHASKPWFFGFMNRDEAEAELFRALRGSSSSKFLVRESPKDPGIFALSWSQAGKITHTKIIMQDGYYVFDVAQSVLQQFRARTLTELIESREFQVYLASVEESH
jgi:hypothetical protein